MALPLIAEAAGGLAEALNFTDVLADVVELYETAPTAGEILENVYALSPRNIAAAVRNQPAESAKGAAAILGAVGFKPAIIGAAEHLHKHGGTKEKSKAKKVLRKHSGKYPISKISSPVRRRFSPIFTTPQKPIRTETMPSFSGMRSKRKRKGPAYYRGGSKFRKGPLKFSSSLRDRVSSGSTTITQNQIVVKKLALAPTPTVANTGATNTFVLTNFGLKAQNFRNGQGSFGYHFKLSQFPQYTEYTQLYQWYKILSVRLTFYPEQNAHESISANAASVSYDGAGSKVSTAPLLVVSPDQTSDALFGTINDAMAHHNSRFHSFNSGKEFSIYLSPKPNSLIGNSGGEVRTLSSANKWITTDSAEVEHYGLRCYMDRFPDAASVYVVMEMKVAFKQPKT